MSPTAHSSWRSVSNVHAVSLLEINQSDSHARSDFLLPNSQQLRALFSRSNSAVALRMIDAVTSLCREVLLSLSDDLTVKSLLTVRG